MRRHVLSGCGLCETDFNRERAHCEWWGCVLCCAVLSGAGSTEMRVLQVLKQQAATCNDSAKARVFRAMAGAFTVYVQQLVVNAGQSRGSVVMQLLEEMHGAGSDQAGIDCDGEAVERVTCQGGEVRDLLSAKLGAMRGAVRLVCDLLSIDQNLSTKLGQPKHAKSSAR
eukprot:TRINITY_DN7308_c0_g1_i5.p3 TRINITY_DN7308_c0_g1~~TRINITY_DN7308_c0_g1_i5.p3  ORF type:complete len:169 (-),score=47.40 TRINITY_DN7308_c0_g1_i5:3-509(-)